MILTLAFWRAAGTRALRTVLIAALPVLAPLIGGDWNTTRQALLALALAGVASLATSLVSLPELGGGRTRWHALVDRVARTFGQVVAATIVAGIAWGDVRWADLLFQATVAALGTLLIGLTGTLPEVPDGALAALVDTGPLPGVGRVVRYTSKAGDGVASPAVVLRTRAATIPGVIDRWGASPVGTISGTGRPVGLVAELPDDLTVDLLVHGLGGDYREYAVPHGNGPGAWSWPPRR